MYFELLEPDRSKSMSSSTKENTKEDNQLVGGEEGRREGKYINSIVAHESLWIPSKVIVI